MRALALLGLLALAGCTPPAPEGESQATPAASGVSLSGYGTVGVAKTF